MDQLLACEECAAAHRTWPVSFEQLFFNAAAAALVDASQQRPPGGSFGDVLRNAEGATPWACEGEYALASFCVNFILISPPGGSFGDVLRNAESAAPWACDGT